MDVCCIPDMIHWWLRTLQAAIKHRAKTTLMIRFMSPLEDYSRSCIDNIRIRSLSSHSAAARSASIKRKMAHFSLAALNVTLSWLTRENVPPPPPPPPVVFILLCWWSELEPVTHLSKSGDRNTISVCLWPSQSTTWPWGAGCRPPGPPEEHLAPGGRLQASWPSRPVKASQMGLFVFGSWFKGVRWERLELMSLVYLEDKEAEMRSCAWENTQAEAFV